jgi:NAD(P)-dependent dehydrogenase (short-subunit alcohol dehydrogenase family)
MKELTGRTAVVTGAASGIGRALARTFSAVGMNVVLAGIEEPPLQAAVSDLAQQGFSVLGVRTDVSSAEAIETLAAQTIEHFGGVHILCNNAGVNALGVPVWEMPLSTWEWVLGVNLWGAINGIRAFVPRLVVQDEGHVVNVSSIAGLGGVAGLAPYSTTKHGLLGLSEVLLRDLRAVGSQVGVSVVCPSIIKSRIHESERNWPTRLGALPSTSGPAASPDLEAMRASAPGPQLVADAVLAAIRTDRFFVAPDPIAVQYAMDQRLATMAGDPPEPT